MSIGYYSLREEALDLKEKLLDAESQKFNGVKTYSQDEVTEMLMNIINGKL